MFEGLLPGQHNIRVIKLLFVAAHWHGLAKLRLHIDPTLDILDKVTSLLGNRLRDFVQHTCGAYETRELRREADARNRRQLRKANKNVNPTGATNRGGAHKAGLAQNGTYPDSGPLPQQPGLQDNGLHVDKASGSECNNGRQRKTLNLNTYKHHALGDVANTVRRYGTTDSYSTEPV